MTNPIPQVTALGQSLWYDNIQRRLLENGEMAALIRQGDIRGMTSNPSIFNNAIAKSPDYDGQLLPLVQAGLPAMEIYEALAIKDIQSAADLFRGLYDETEGGDGFVSLEVSPYLAHDTAGTVAEARRLWDAVERPNLMIKIPATAAGLPAIQQTIAAGINVNITLIFSVERYLDVMEAYLAGLETRVAAGERIDRIASVASFFISRIDTKIDKRLDEIVRGEGVHAAQAASLRGRIAVANAKAAYQQFRSVFRSGRFARLRAAGGRVQRPLWASTSTKNPAYPDVKYVEELIGPDTVNTVPPETLAAFKDHGKAALTLEADLAGELAALAGLEAVGVSLAQATQELEDEGVKAFATAFTGLLKTIEGRRTK